MDDFELDVMQLEREEADYLDGWEAMQEMLAADEQWAKESFQAFLGNEY